jgi:hypothetical protein
MDDSFAHSLASRDRPRLLRRLVAQLALAAALFGVAAQLPARAHACSCMMQAQPDAYEQSVAVFEGHVLEVKAPPSPDAPGQTSVRMQVVRAWKGIESEEVTITTAANSAACGYAFAVDESYLVYADALDGELQVSLCSRTQPIAAAGEDLKALGLGATPVNPKAQAPEVVAQEPRPTEPPARGGCAGCATTGGGAGAPLSAGAAVLLSLLLTCRRRSGPRS